MTARSEWPDPLRIVPDICQVLGLVESQLNRYARLVRTDGYLPFQLVNGGKRRTIHRPRPWLKNLQRNVLDHILSRYSVSDAVFSVRGRGVIANARQHLSRAHLVVLDIKDCFPSTRVQMVRDALTRIGLEARAVELLARLVTYQDMLPQGPPTSPGILNLVFAPIDEALTELAATRGALYTRYMDDLAFSADVPLQGLAEDAGRIVRCGGFRLNMQKRRVWGPDDQHTITKIVVTSTLNPEPEYLEDLATQIALLSTNSDPRLLRHLAGRVAWVEALNPSLGRALHQTLLRAQRPAQSHVGS